jgi:GntR family transcriptional regulator
LVGAIKTNLFGVTRNLEVDKAEPLALHDQVAAKILRAIADGEARQGERIPPAVDVAAVLAVNKNTVIRAFSILRDEGLLEFTRGRAVRVVGTPQRSDVLSAVDDPLRFARHQRYCGDDLIALVRARP